MSIYGLPPYVSLPLNKFKEALAEIKERKGKDAEAKREAPENNTEHEGELLKESKSFWDNNYKEAYKEK